MPASYQPQGIVHHIGVVYPRRTNQLRLFIPKGHQLAAGTLVTLHLGNRTGVDELDAELRVYRASYKGRGVETDDNWVMVDPVEYVLIHGVRAVEEYREPGYAFPIDTRPARDMPLSPLRHLGTVEEKDHHNKVGVLTTLAQGQPHTTVLAFLSSLQDDVFLISMPGTFKSQVLKREPRCFFTIDERAKFTFEQSIEWNYTNMEMRAPPGAHRIAGVRADSHRVHPEKPVGSGVLHEQRAGNVPSRTLRRGVRRRIAPAPISPPRPRACAPPPAAVGPALEQCSKQAPALAQQALSAIY